MFDWSSASPAQRRAYVARVNDAECAAQGLPRRITDPVALHRLAALFSAPALPADALRPPGAPHASAGTGGSEPDTTGEPGASTHSREAS